MARKTIKNHTYANHMLVMNKLMTEKGYDFKTADGITRQLFCTLEQNPQGNIWVWFDQVITAKEYNEIQQFNKIWELYEKGMITRLECQQMSAAVRANW